jgi:hypothetical protein
MQARITLPLVPAVLLAAALIPCQCSKAQPEPEGCPDFPLEVPEQNALLARWAAKPVQQSRVLDDMEQDTGWRVFGIGEMSYTQSRARDGTRSLRFRTSLRDEEHYRRHRSEWGSFNGSQGGNTAIQRRFDEPQDWSAFNRISLWVYVHPTSMPTYCIHLRFACEGAPHNATSPGYAHFVHDLKPGQWNHVLWEIPHLRRDRVTDFAIHQMLRGHEPEDEGIVTYDFDRLELQRVEADPYEGWGVAPGRFAFCHTGYRPADPKRALAGAGCAETFELIRSADRQSVFSGEVRTVENRRGAFRLLDFSEFRTPGVYCLRSGSLQSPPFRIAEDIWIRPLTKAVNFFFCERCGYPVPGIHRECHQDWQGFRGDVKKVINGGWHDAGDLSQGTWRTALATFAMLRIVEQLRENGECADLERRVLEEARWGLQWLLRTRFSDGFRMHWSTMRIYTDNQVGTIDDVVSPARNVPWENYLTAAVETLAAELLQRSDPDLAERCRVAAREDWQAATASRANSSIP